MMSIQTASTKTAEIIRTNWHVVCEQVADACHSASRQVPSVQIVGVSKYVSPELALQLAQAGCSLLGENRPQSIWEKFDYFRNTEQPTSASWHMIGHLQRNKLRRTLPLIQCLHSLDSLRLAESLNQEAVHSDLQIDVLVEVNVTEDESKTGLSPDGILELLDKIGEFGQLNLIGLMAMSSRNASVNETRNEFASVRELRDTLNSRYSSLRLAELSMGMSNDFREAIAEGATMVRIGSSLWKSIL